MHDYDIDCYNVMGLSPRTIMLYFESVDFPFEEIGIVLVGIKAILDPKTRPLGLDSRNRSGTCLFWLYVLTLHLFMHGLPLFQIF